MNSHIDGLLRLCQSRYSHDSVSMSLSDWIIKNTVLRGTPFSFDRYPFQETIAADEHPNLCCRKPSQVGLTEIQIRKMLAWLRRRTMKGVFTMPNLAMYKRISKTRIKPTLDENKVFTPEDFGDKPARSMDIIQIGNSFLFVTAANEGDATSIDADIVMNDEVDLTDEAMLALFNSRLENSDYHIKQGFSTPTYLGRGIDTMFAGSDQHEYMLKCAACGHHQIPDFTLDFVDLPGFDPDLLESLADIEPHHMDKLDVKNAVVRCEKHSCRAPLDLGDSTRRQWVPRHPSRVLSRGYNVLPFSTDRRTIPRIITSLLDYKRLNNMKGWYNTVLGKPYSDASVQLTKAAVEACFDSANIVAPSSDQAVWMGIDIGQVCHLVLGVGNTAEACRVFLFESFPVAEIFDRVTGHIANYNVVGGTLDRHPYTPTADAIFTLTKGKIVPLEYRGSKRINVIKDPLGNLTHAQANRTQLLDQVASGVRRSSLRMGGFTHYRQMVIDHLCDMVREEPEEANEKEAKWIKSSTGADHFMHALAFMLGAIELKEIEYEIFTEEFRETVLVKPAAIGVANPVLIGRKKSNDRTNPFN